MSRDTADQDRTKARPLGPLLLILTALAAVVWVTSPTASGDEGRAADGLSAEVSTTR